jgi:ATP-dependent RNA helicase DeaD
VFQIPGLTLTENVARALSADGIQAPHAAQAEAVAAILAGRHVVIHAGTGTGKTLAYLLPALQYLREHEGHRVVVCAPGVELAMQTLRVADAYKDDAISTAPAVATSSKSRQRDRLQRGTRLVVGTPDRLAELFHAAKLKGMRLLVLDELDPILATRESAFLDELLPRSEPKVQLVVATATLGPASAKFVARWMPDAVWIRPSADPLQSAITHRVVEVPRGERREEVLSRFLRDNRCAAAIVFVVDPEQQRLVYNHLVQRGVSVVTVGKEATKSQRQRSLDEFRRGNARVLLTSDEVARGLDVPDVAWVLHYDLPATAEDYVHRAGRTGRAGRSGTSVLLASPSAHTRWSAWAQALGITFT